MKNLFTLSVIALLVLSVMPMVLAVSVGSGIGIDITTEDFAPLVWACDSRVVYDDNTEPGRVVPAGGECSNKPGAPVGTVCAGLSKTACTVTYPNVCDWNSAELVERINNYAFEGEQIKWTVLVMDKNKIDQNIDVYATIGSSQGQGNDIEVNCKRVTGQTNLSTCNARILEEQLVWNANTMAFFECTLTVETPLNMYGEYWITVEAQDGDGLMGTMDENEYWFLNPEINLNVDGELTFEDVRPGTQSYSSTLLIGNDADDGSGVMLDMFISGTDFYDSASSGARCPTTNQLSLSRFAYFATNGAYSTKKAFGAGYTGPTADIEGYKGIVYGIGFNNPNPFYDKAEILPAQKVGPYYTANLLAPGAEMSLTFRLSLPEPCNGDFDTGSIYFWGEAI